MNLTAMIETGADNPLLLFAAALLLGGLHGLEPGHSKTMIAAYIVAIRGTVWQAVLLGISAAVSHSLIVWVLAYLALTWGDGLIATEFEPVLTGLSGVIILGIATWMFVDLRRNAAGGHVHAHDHGHSHVHGHHHHHADHAHGHDHGMHAHHHHHHHDHGHAHHAHALQSGSDYHFHFDKKEHVHAHDHGHGPADHGLLDAHAMAHAREIEKRVGAGKTSTWQTLLFGFSGGLIPCAAAITVFLLCLQLGQLALGITLVTAFSTGLAITLVLVGTAAAIGIRAVGRHMPRFEPLLRAAPLLSAALVTMIGYLMLYSAFGDAVHAHI